MLLFVVLLTPFILFLGGAYVLHYPVTLGLLYAFNLVLMYIVLWMLANQVMLIYTQKMGIENEELLLSRKQIFLSLPVIRVLDLNVSLKDIKKISLSSTRIGYFLTMRFDHGDKTMGIDLDLNPLSIKNRDVLQLVLSNPLGITTDEGTARILDEYSRMMGSWKGNYVFSFLVLGLALVAFLVISLLLGMKIY